MARSQAPAPHSHGSKALAIGAGVVLLTALAGCTPADPATSPTTPATSAATETAAPTTTAAATPTSVAAAGALNCSNVVADARFTDPSVIGIDVAEGWGLNEQIIVTGGDLTLDFRGDTDASLDTPIETGVSCVARGGELEATQTCAFARMPAGHRAAIEAWADGLGLERVTTASGASHWQLDDDGGHGSTTAVTVGDDWVAYISGSLRADFSDAFTGELRDVDANDAIAEGAKVETCSMFFEPMTATGALPPITMNFGPFTAQRNATEQFATDWVDGSTTDFHCNGIVWQPGGTDAVPTGEPVASNDECELYEVGTDSYVAVRPDACIAEITAPLDYAAQVVPPKFRDGA